MFWPNSVQCVIYVFCGGAANPMNELTFNIFSSRPLAAGKIAAPSPTNSVGSGIHMSWPVIVFRPRSNWLHMMFRGATAKCHKIRNYVHLHAPSNIFITPETGWNFNIVLMFVLRPCPLAYTLSVSVYSIASFARSNSILGVCPGSPEYARFAIEQKNQTIQITSARRVSGMCLDRRLTTYFL